MGNKKLGQEPAFPNENTAFCQPPDCYGLSKRFYAACVAMQGILSNQNGEYGVYGETNQKYAENLISQSYKFADELLKQENL